jgi:hypothetical protein
MMGKWSARIRHCRENNSRGALAHRLVAAMTVRRGKSLSMAFFGYHFP